MEGFFGDSASAVPQTSSQGGHHPSWDSPDENATHCISCQRPIQHYWCPCGVTTSLRSFWESHNRCFLNISPAYKDFLCQKMAEECRLQVTETLRDINSELYSILSNIEDITFHVKRQSELLKCRIDKDREALFKQLTRFKNMSVTSRGDMARRCSDVLGCLDSWFSSGDRSTDVLQDIIAKVIEMTRLRERPTDGKLTFSPSETASVGHLRIPPCPRMSSVKLRGPFLVKEVNFGSVCVRDKMGERVVNDEEYSLTLTVLGPDHETVNARIRNRRGGKFEFSFVPLQRGPYLIQVMVNDRVISNSPLRVLITRESPIHSLTVFGKGGEADGEFCRPWGVCCDSRGRILVCDRSNSRIQVFSANGEFIQKFGRPGSEPGEFDTPAGITTGREDRIIVADKGNHRIQIFDSSGGFISVFGKLENREDLLYPWDVATDDSGNIAVVESKKSIVRLFTEDGVELRRITFNKIAGLDQPRGICWRSDGSFVITEFNQHRIVLLDRDLGNPRVLGEQGQDAGNFFRPQGVDVFRNGLMAVSDCKNHRIQIFKDNEVWKVIGRQGSEYGEFEAPQDIAFHPNGNLIVVDFGNNRIQILDLGINF